MYRYLTTANNFLDDRQYLAHLIDQQTIRTRLIKVPVPRLFIEHGFYGSDRRRLDCLNFLNNKDKVKPNPLISLSLIESLIHERRFDLVELLKPALPVDQYSLSSAAIFSNQLDLLKTLNSYSPYDLFLAATMDRAEMVEFLLDKVDSSLGSMITNAAILTGNLKTLDLLRQHGYQFDQHSLGYGVVKDIVFDLIDRGEALMKPATNIADPEYQLNMTRVESLVLMAVYYDRLKIVQYVFEQEIELDETFVAALYYYAVRNKSLMMVKLLYPRGRERISDLAEQAVNANSIEILDWAVDNDFDPDRIYLKNTISIEMAEHLIKKEYHNPASIYYSAIKYGDLDLLDYLYSRWPKDILQTDYQQANDIKIVAWLDQRQIPLNSGLAGVAVINGNLEIYEFCLKRGLVDQHVLSLLSTSYAKGKVLAKYYHPTELTEEQIRVALLKHDTNRLTAYHRVVNFKAEDVDRYMELGHYHLDLLIFFYQLGLIVENAFYYVNSLKGLKWLCKQGEQPLINYSFPNAKGEELKLIMTWVEKNI